MNTDNWLERTELLLGKEKLDLLRKAHVLVVGLGGVGAYAAEMIVRAGVGRMTIADADDVAPSNINRQLVALHSTVGRRKAEILAERLRDINPEIELTVSTVTSRTRRPTCCSTPRNTTTQWTPSTPSRPNWR